MCSTGSWRRICAWMIGCCVRWSFAVMGRWETSRRLVR
ncbi:hypothetical protein GBAR_LOCUS31021 [Geodia barretti]|uniref:Uncharacterized protein n=1 Tax=Geodia barretti TaxID=519541 RepID=A0AA35XFI8_GEOBA|nr:hypothetical protein GBAR_LOCUS31021 [Geodia barretti]